MNPRENMLRSKEVLGAYFRQGAHELGAALFPPGTASTHPEYGMAFTRTPGEIADGMRGRETDARDNVEPSQLQQHLEQAQQRDHPEPEVSREPEIERD